MCGTVRRSPINVCYLLTAIPSGFVNRTVVAGIFVPPCFLVPGGMSVGSTSVSTVDNASVIRFTAPGDNYRGTFTPATGFVWTARRHVV
jgi:hypothetical protein